jgi:hypothetical protein
MEDPAVLPTPARYERSQKDPFSSSASGHTTGRPRGLKSSCILCSITESRADEVERQRLEVLT